MREHVMRAGLGDLLEKVEEGVRLSFEDGVRLYRHGDLHAVGYLANMVRERVNGDATFYNVNLHINYSNMCTLECGFCAFGKKMRDPDAYEYSLDEILEKARAASGEGCTELHMVGGLHPRWRLDDYLNMLRALKRAVPQIHLKCFTAVEVEHIARVSRLSIEDALSVLAEAGLDSLPGGGAEIFAWRARRQICAPKLDGERWKMVHRAAHQMGMKSTCTMLYGHVETIEERVDHMVQLREMQDDAVGRAWVNGSADADQTGRPLPGGGFTCFVPLSFHPANTHLEHLPKPSAITDLRSLAVGRLMLDNIPHVKAYWIMQEIYLAQVSLAYGVDDIDGTVRQEKIYHMAGAQTPEYLPVEEIRRLISEAGRVPVERDSVYRRVVREGDAVRWRALEPVGG